MVDAIVHGKSISDKYIGTKDSLACYRNSFDTFGKTVRKDCQNVSKILNVVYLCNTERKITLRIKIKTLVDLDLCVLRGLSNFRASEL